MVKFIIEFEKTIELGIILKNARERFNNSRGKSKN